MNPFPGAIVLDCPDAPHPLLAGFAAGVALVMVVVVVVGIIGRFGREVL